MRLALAVGMHTDMKSERLEPSVVQRCRRIWWTVFVLDSQMSALMGLPMNIQDSDMSAPLPEYPGSPTKTAAVKIHVKLSQALSQIINGLRIHVTGHLSC